jgi:hypothetical protein
MWRGYLYRQPCDLFGDYSNSNFNSNADANSPTPTPTLTRALFRVDKPTNQPSVRSVTRNPPQLA